MAHLYNPRNYHDPIDRSFTNPIDRASARSSLSIMSIAPSSRDPTITSSAFTSTAEPFNGSLIRLTTPQQRLLEDVDCLPDILERCIVFPRVYALARPDKYPNMHRVLQQLMLLSVNGVKTEGDGVDFTAVSSTINAEELGMVYVCRTYGVDPVDYLRAVRSEDCRRVAQSIYASDPGGWDRWSKLYEQRKFSINPESYAQIAYALTGPFKDKCEAVLSKRLAVRAIFEGLSYLLIILSAETSRWPD